MTGACRYIEHWHLHDDKAPQSIGAFRHIGRKEQLGELAVPDEWRCLVLHEPDCARQQLGQCRANEHGAGGTAGHTFGEPFVETLDLLGMLQVRDVLLFVRRVVLCSDSISEVPVLHGSPQLADPVKRTRSSPARNSA